MNHQTDSTPDPEPLGPAPAADPDVAPTDEPAPTNGHRPVTPLPWWQRRIVWLVSAVLALIAAGAGLIGVSIYTYASAWRDDVNGQFSIQNSQLTSALAALESAREADRRDRCSNELLAQFGFALGLSFLTPPAPSDERRLAGLDFIRASQNLAKGDVLCDPETGAPPPFVPTPVPTTPPAG